MIGVFVVFLLIVVLPYLLYFKRRYNESSNKKEFLQNNLYHSTLWILLLVVIPVAVVNFLFSDSIPKSTAENSKRPSLDSLMSMDPSNMDFHFRYINRLQALPKSDSLLNVAHEKYEAVSDTLADISHWGLGYLFTIKEQPDSGIFHLSKVEDKSLKYLNYAIAMAHAGDENDSLYVHHLLVEAKLNEGAKTESIVPLVNKFNESKSLILLEELIEIPEAQVFLDYRITRKTLLLNGKLGKYFRTIFEWFGGGIYFTGFIAAILVLLVWATYLIKLAFFDRPDWALLSFALIAGMLFSFLTFLLSDTLHFVFGLWEEMEGGWNLLFSSVFGIGAVEELVKIIPLLITIAIAGKKLQPYHYILTASASALGFAFIENLIYFDGSYGLIIHGRALTSAVGHMVFSSVFSYGMVLSHNRRTPLKPVVAFLVFWFFAALAHGLYDYWLFIKLVPIFILYFFLITRIWITIINNCINNSDQFAYTTGFDTQKIQFYLAFSLTAILMFEYLLVAVQEGKYSANANLTVAAFSGSYLIMFLGSKLSTFNLIKGYWGRMNYSANPFSDDVVSQNFVGQNVFLKNYTSPHGWIEFFPDGIKGKIVSRVVLRNKPANWLKSNDDPDWFLVKLDSEMMIENHLREKVLIKFKEAYSSLNAKKSFLAHLLLIPSRLQKPKNMRGNFPSLGWIVVTRNSNNNG